MYVPSNHRIEGMAFSQLQFIPEKMNITVANPTVEYLNGDIMITVGPEIYIKDACNSLTKKVVTLSWCICVFVCLQLDN